MAYVKISDPSVIDLSAWQQLINVVNEHSDSISALTNTFGLSQTPNYVNDDWEAIYDPSVQKIQFGRFKIVSADTSVTRTGAGGVGVDWEESWTFTTPFTSTPSVMATVQSSSTSQANDNIIVTTSSISSTGFKIRLFRPIIPATLNAPSDTTELDGKDISGTVYISWVAVGPTT